mgnify:CR=1 FL=1
MGVGCRHVAQRLGCHNDLSASFTAAQQFQRVGGLIKRQHVANVGLQATSGIPVQQVPHAIGQGRRIEFQISAPIEPDQGDIFDQQMEI